MPSEQLTGILGRRQVPLLEDVRVASLLVFAGSVLIRLPGLHRLPWTDELYTMMAAHGWLSDGVPRIGEGVYNRAEGFTALIAWFFRAFGESLVVARLPSLIAGSLLVVVVFLWTRWAAGTMAAWIAAAFMAFSPLAIQMSQFARFYALFGLLFSLGAIGFYMLVERRFSAGRSLGVAAGVVGCWLVALHLQVLTLVGLVAIGFWFATCQFLPWIIARRHQPKVWGLVGLLAVVAVAAAVVGIEHGLARTLLDGYRDGPLTALEQKNQVWFYHLEFIDRYPSLWPIVPFAAMLAASVRPQPSLFCLCLFGVSFAILSFGTMKHFQYLYFVLPFLFVLWGISLAAALPPLGRWLRDVIDRLLELVAPRLPRGRSRVFLLSAGVLFLILANGAPARTLLKPFGISLRDDAVLVDWSSGKTLLEPRLHDAAVVLSPSDVQALYYLDRLDVVVNASRLTEYGGREFSRDPRTGKVVISTPESLNLVIDCSPSGLFLTDPVSWQAAWAMPHATANVVENRLTAIELPPDLKMLAFSWQHPTPAAPPAECDKLPPSARGAAKPQ